MRFSDNCLLLITTVLENEGYSATDDEVREALTEMFEGKRPPTTNEEDDQYSLRPGECYVIRDEDDRAYLEDYHSREKLDEVLNDYARECVEERRDLDDRIQVFIKRCDVPIRAENKVTVTFG